MAQAFTSLVHLEKWRETPRVWSPGVRDTRADANPSLFGILEKLFESKAMVVMANWKVYVNAAMSEDLHFLSTANDVFMTGSGVVFPKEWVMKVYLCEQLLIAFVEGKTLSHFVHFSIAYTDYCYFSIISLFLTLIIGKFYSNNR